MTEEYDVIIVGGGVTGTALLYVLSNYTNAERIALIEKYNAFAEVNSHYNNNSQTLHFGDIETNYTLEKAQHVKRGAGFLAAYMERCAKDAFYKTHKMVLAVGAREVDELEKRYEEIKELFPNLQRLERDEIARIEPEVMKGRDPGEKVLALMSSDGYMVNYKKIAESFVKQARSTQKIVDIFLGVKAKQIKRRSSIWIVHTEKGNLKAGVLVVAAGPHSLIFARSVGYGKEFGILPVAGSFYRAQNVLAGKVYTMQIQKLPFAAIHGDPDVNDRRETRFGPTSKILPVLERHHYETMVDFLKTSVFTIEGVLSLLKIISDRTIFSYVLKNMAYDLPIVGKRMFLQGVQKIVPSIRLEDLVYGKGLGGIRPQVVNTKAKKMEMGEAKIIENHAIFDITPSPGASVCLDSARKNAAIIKQFMGESFQFDEERFLKDFAFNYREREV